MKGNSVRNICFGYLVVLIFMCSTQVLAGETTRASIGLGGVEGNSGSDQPSISANGRWLAFNSDASNLVAGDTNDSTDIFVYDRITGETVRINVASSGAQANNNSRNSPSISADGRWVAFASFADNLVAQDTNDSADVFVHDRLTHETVLVSVEANGVQGNNHSWEPNLSADGRWVAFYSEASNLDGNDTNGYGDVFIHDRLTGKTRRISVDSNGEQGDGYSESPKMSADGRFIAFGSGAANLVAGDTNGVPDIFVHDRVSRATTRVNVSSSGAQVENGNSIMIPYGISISANGRWISFESYADNLVAGDTNGSFDVFLHDRLTGETRRISEHSDGTQGNNYSARSSLSANGRFVAFESSASNLVAGDSNGFNDIFVYDRWNRQTKRTSVKSKGGQANNVSVAPSISADGRWVAFASFAANLVADDLNRNWDVFLRDTTLTYLHQGDLEVEASQQPVSLVADSDGNYSYTVTNNGPNTIYRVKITHLISNGKVVSLIPSQGACQRYASISLCDLQQLSGGESLTLQVKVKAIRDSLSQQLTVSSGARFDPQPANNLLAMETPVLTTE